MSDRIDITTSPASSAEARWAEGPAGPLAWALWLYTTRPVLVGLALVAAAGRALQVGWAERAEPDTFWVLEFLVEPARLLIAVVMIGAGSLRLGLHTLRRFWARRHDDNAPSALAAAFDTSRIRRLARSLLAALLAMTAFALFGNWCIARIAQTESAVAIAERLLGADDGTGSAAVVLFLKNLTLIPVGILWYGGLYRMLLVRARS